MSTENASKISLLLSRHLNLEGYNAENTTNRKNSTVCHDMFVTAATYIDGTEHYYTAGSTAEGTDIIESDKDAMISCRGMEISNKDNDVIRDGKIMFVRNIQESSPGYVKLTPSVFNKTLEHPFLRINLTDLLINHEQNRYLSSEKFRMVMLKMQNDTLPFRSVQHGPCVMSEIDSLYADGFINNNIKPEEIDFAFAIPCRDWPEEADEWKIRSRLHGWPSDSMIKKICRMICHVVAVGNAGSDACSIQWRQSFLLCERSLVWSFNDVQIQCYVIVKQIVKSYLEPMATNQISSYNIKTLLFWMSEEEGLVKWKPTNLLACVWSCLSRLAVCIKTKLLLHYFMNKANLFHSKFSIEKESDDLIHTIQKIQCEIVDYTLRIGLCKNSLIGKVYEACEGNLVLFENEAKSISQLTTRYQKTLSKYQTIRKFRSIFIVCKRFTHNGFSRIRQDAIKTSPELKLSSLDCEERTLIQIGAYVQIRKGLIAEYQRYTETENVKEKSDLDQMALKCFKEGSKLDLMSGPLYLATYYLKKGDVEMCLNTVEKMLDELPQRMIYIGFSSADQYIGYENGKLIPVKIVEDNKAVETLPAVFDMLFTKDDHVIVPPYLVASCILLPDFGDRYLTIHPCIYALYLRHYATCIWEGTSNEKTQTTFDQMEDFIKEHNVGPLAFHANNLLGICLMALKKNRHALNYFAKSLAMTSKMPLVRNAAVWWTAFVQMFKL